MRSSSAAFFEGLRRIVDGIEPRVCISEPEAQDRLFAEIRKSEEESGVDVIQIHEFGLAHAA